MLGHFLSLQEEGVGLLGAASRGAVDSSTGDRAGAPAMEAFAGRAVGIDLVSAYVGCGVEPSESYG